MAMMVASLLLLAIQTQSSQAAPAAIEPRNNPYRRFQLKNLQTIKVTVAEKHEFATWVMDEEAKRQEGMMFLEDKDFTSKQAMIFIFKSPEPLRFWMKNTFVPLDIAYISGAGKIDSMYTMEAFDTTSDYSSAGSCMYALEMKVGTIKKLGLKVGDSVKMNPIVRAKD